MESFLPIIVPAFSLFLVLAAQNALFLTTASLLYVCKALSALELYSALCLLFFSLRFLTRRRPLCFPRLFALVFSPVPLFCIAVLFEFDFNALSILTSVFCAGLLCASALCIVLALVPKKRRGSPYQSVFSGRENEVVSLILQGKTTQETADALFISLATVKTHLQHIYAKAGVRNRAELALFVQNHPFGG